MAAVRELRMYLYVEEDITGVEYLFPVEPESTVGDFKFVVAVAFGWPLEQVRLHFQRKPLDRDSDTLVARGVSHEDRLLLTDWLVKLEVECPGGSVFEFFAEATDLIAIYFEDLREKVHLVTKVLPEHQLFLLEGQQLDVMSNLLSCGSNRVVKLQMSVAAD